ncbi:MAG TPA: S-adenosylmethionine-dependent methyltransferase [Spirochaetia bacterium]|nr:S-adenosylmethionine-dependent methyltransferase [Spirochaetia bacterium]
MQHKEFQLQPIGRVRAVNDTFRIELDDQFRPGLRHLDKFGHVIVLWWAHEHDNPEDRKRVTTSIPYAHNLTAGVFACRSEYRPNPIALTVCACLEVDEKQGLVSVPYIDAHDGSPVLDLKAYFPVADRVRNIRPADWVKDWPEWYEEAYQLEALFAHMCE